MMLNASSEDAITTPKPVNDKVIMPMIAVRLPIAVIIEARKPSVTAFVMHNKTLGPGDAVNTNTANV